MDVREHDALRGALALKGHDYEQKRVHSHGLNDTLGQYGPRRLPQD